MKIALLGTGHMGAAMAGRLAATGHSLTVWNRTPGRAAALGLPVAATPAEAVTGADVVITMLTDGAAVTATGLPGIVADGTLVVQMSTVSPAETAALAASLPAGVDLVDAPVAGSVDAAAAGSLIVLAGGTPEALRRAEPVLRDLGTVRECGPVGAGTARKLVVNTAVLAGMAALRDTLAVAAAVGVDRSDALATLAAGPLAGVVKRAANDEASFAVALAAKDLALAVGEAGDVPVAAAALELLRGFPDPAADIGRLP